MPYNAELEKAIVIATSGQGRYSWRRHRLSRWQRFVSLLEDILGVNFY